MQINLISPDQLWAKMKSEDLLLVDTRNAAVFGNSFVPGSVSVGDSGKYDKWISEELKPSIMVVITDAGQEEAGFLRFSQLVAAQSLWALEGGYPAWTKAGLPIDMIITVEADELALDLPHDSALQLIDVRGEEEFESAHVAGAEHIPLAELIDLVTIANFDEDQNLYLYCEGGQRSFLGASLIKRQGTHNLRVVEGGFDAIQSQPSIKITQKPSHS
jgi:hydroxyacylglutathione hydrolase